jgi:hypothetical protein
MRWPWQRHGRRRRSDALPQPQIDPWAASWGETFLPQPPLRSAVIEPTPTPTPTPTSTVRLGFTDGTELELDESALLTSSLHAAARALIGIDRQQLS